MIRRLFLPVLLNLGLLSAVLAGGQMRVTADGVNVRCGPGTRFEIVCQVNEGDLVTVRRQTDEWVEIAPPPEARLWVYGELLQDDTVIASRLQVRSGPGISYRPAGKLDKGYKVTVLERAGEWVRIAPPLETAVWISQEYLEPPETPVKVSAPATVPESDGALPEHATGSEPQPVAVKQDVVVAPKPTLPGPEPERPASRAVPQPSPQRQVVQPAGAVTEPAHASEIPVALRGRRLASDRRQGEKVILEGEIRSARGMWGRLSGFRLVGRDAEGHAITRCYILGNAEQLESILGRRASIEGALFWVYRVRYPGVRPDRIRLYPERNSRSEQGGG